MHAYIFSPNSQTQPQMLTDLKAVKAKVRTLPKESRDWARVTLEDFPNDKEAYVQAWNGHQPASRQVLKKWRIGGARGGRLIEIPVTEE